ncbi:hypothetical protein Patl1_22335 [Pistacia atlantica]|uniref:Uncharacterized protein n=1 Tax=Pistacia atlantica TaxID=434234 RepID=A0ACC1A0R5_9ROSI|nr:hypothetical protein Patl1_22335 [Pistacia atlantica]
MDRLLALRNQLRKKVYMLSARELSIKWANKSSLLVLKPLPHQALRSRVREGGGKGLLENVKMDGLRLNWEAFTKLKMMMMMMIRR